MPLPISNYLELIRHSKEGQTLFFSTPFFKGVPTSSALCSTDSLWLKNCMISQSLEPFRGRVAKVLVQKLLRAAEAEKQILASFGYFFWAEGSWLKTCADSSDFVGSCWGSGVGGSQTLLRRLFFLRGGRTFRGCRTFGSVDGGRDPKLSSQISRCFLSHLNVLLEGHPFFQERVELSPPPIQNTYRHESPFQNIFGALTGQPCKRSFLL